MVDPWKLAEAQMAEQGLSLDSIPRVEHVRHLWADGILYWWTSHRRLPTGEELAADMLDEWDDPVSVDEANHILSLIRAGRKL